jgi:hypothetical protein
VWSEGRFSGGSQVFVTEAEATMVAVDEFGHKVPISGRAPK